MKTKLLFITLILTATCYQLTAQTIVFDGDIDSDWNTAANWVGDVLPGPGNDVDLDGNTVVLSANAQVLRVYAGGSSDFTINAGVTLTVTGFAGGDDGLEIQGSAAVLNNGTIAISNISGAAGDGLYVKGAFTNSVTGTVTIDGTGEYNIYVQGGICTNNGTMTLTNFGQANTDRDGIAVDDDGGTPGTFNNDAGSITITMTGSDDGIYVNDSSTFNNAAVLTVGGAGGDNGIRVDDGAAFNNNSGGIFTINSTPDDQLFLDNDGAFNNAGTVNLSNALDVGLYVTDEGIFTNNVAGMVNISSSSNYAIQVDANNSTANIANNGTITITGGSNDGIRLQEMGIFNNNVGATLNITNAGDEGIQVDDGATPVSTFNNNGMVNITNSTDHGMELFGIFNNFNGGTFKATNCTDDGIRLQNNGVFNNDGAIDIDGSGSEDIETETVASFINTANATFAPGSSPGDLEIRDDFDLGAATVTFEINGTTPTTDYDQIKASTSAETFTVGASTKINLVWGFTPTIGDKFQIIDASGTLSGAIDIGNVTSTHSVTVNVVGNDLEVEVTGVLSTNEVNISDFKVYPNPANSVVSIVSSNLNITSVEIHDLLGKKVHEQYNLSDNTNIVNVSDLSNGIYLLTIKSDNKSFTKKLVIK